LSAGLQAAIAAPQLSSQFALYLGDELSDPSRLCASVAAPLSDPT